MGQGQSGELGPRSISTEQLSHELAVRFAKRCFTPLELYSFKEVFRSLADTQSEIQYWREETLCRFLEIPDALAVGPVMYQSVTYLGAFPFPSLAPSILSFEALLKVIVIMTERYGRVLKRGKRDRIRLLFRSLAVFDRKMSHVEHELENVELHDPDEKAEGNGERSSQEAIRKPRAGFAVDDPVNDSDEDEAEDEDDDELALAALDSLDAIEVFKHGEKSNINHAQIPADNFRRLLMLLIVIAPLSPQESLSKYSDRFADDQLEGLRRTADSILWAFGVEKHPGVLYHNFNAIIPASLPHLFDGFNPLFEHFLFSKTLNLSQRKPSSASGSPPAQSAPAAPAPEPLPPLLPEPGEILDLNTLSQLSFFLPPPSPFRRLRPLFSGASAGFSMGSFETHVFNWRSPTILLVSGTRIPYSRLGGNQDLSNREKAFIDTLPSKRFSDGAKGNSQDNRVVYGAYVPALWKHTPKECFGDTETLLFQLSPIHEVFGASTLSKDYVSFVKPPNSHAGISFGCPPPAKSRQKSGGSGAASSTNTVQLGPVSLFLDDGLEFGVFTHTAVGGGSFHASETRQTDWQDLFQVESLEVWGLGGEEEEKRQRDAFDFEEREAERRRRINVGRGDVEADRALLEMAGLVGQHQSGGSV
ncbi:MAG: Restriction of telomere capping protein 5 [Sclerophora amabilis]|nr:MAG: Restriction of telomere capping protein 5 [Sclerophora amabilis]